MLAKEILSILQKDFPLTKRPFLEIAKRFNSDEESIIKIIKEQKEKKIIRQISPIFDTKKLGYHSTLVAFKVDKQDIDYAVKIINSHPGVSHNYERDHEFNIWFTLALPNNSKFGLEKSVEILASLTYAKEYIILPTIKLFKIAVKLDVTGKEAQKEKIEQKKSKKITLTPLHKKIIYHAQNDIEIISKPFEKIVKKLHIDYDTFFNYLEELKEAGVMRRFAAILNHRKAGFNANAMAVWDIDEKDADTIGKKVAEFSAVSHCYLRPKYKNWHYNLFSMIHAKTKEEANSIIKDIAKEIEFKDKRALYSTKEFKKVRLKYFTSAFLEWEESIVKDIYTPIS